MYNGKHLLTQMEWFNRFVFKGDDTISWLQEWTEALAVMGFQGLLCGSENPQSGWICP